MRARARAVRARARALARRRARARRARAAKRGAAPAAAHGEGWGGQTPRAYRAAAPATAALFPFSLRCLCSPWRGGAGWFMLPLLALYRYRLFQFYHCARNARRAAARALPRCTAARARARRKTSAPRAARAARWLAWRTDDERRVTAWAGGWFGGLGAHTRTMFSIIPSSMLTFHVHMHFAHFVYRQDRDKLPPNFRQIGTCGRHGQTVTVLAVWTIGLCFHSWTLDFLAGTGFLRLHWLPAAWHAALPPLQHATTVMPPLYHLPVPACWPSLPTTPYVYNEGTEERTLCAPFHLTEHPSTGSVPSHYRTSHSTLSAFPTFACLPPGY